MVSDACTPQIEPDISNPDNRRKTVLVIDIVPGKFRPYYIAKKEKRLQLLFELMEQADLLTQEN